MKVAKFTVGVMGSGVEEYNALAEPIGQLVAKLNVNLLTGGGKGVMTSVSRAYSTFSSLSSSSSSSSSGVGGSARGVCMGIIPCQSMEQRTVPKTGYPNQYIELPIYTHLPHSGSQGQKDTSRNHINILTSDAIIALPGSDGTVSEVELAIKYSKPIILYASTEEEIAHFPSSVQRAYDIVQVEIFLTTHIRNKNNNDDDNDNNNNNKQQQSK